MFVTFFLIFKYILIYLLHLLFILKIEGIFRKRKCQPKTAEGSYFLYIYYQKVGHVFFIALTFENY